MRKKARPASAAENTEIFELHAGFCKVIANPMRLMLISRLRDGEVTVGQLVKGTGASLANISQHLRILRDHDIVLTRKEGRSVHYKLRDPRLLEVCALTHAILLGGIQQRNALVQGAPVKRATT